MVRQAFDRIVQHQPALVDDLHPVTSRLHLGQDVGRENHAVIAPELTDEIPDFANLDRIEADGRLVQNHHRRQVDDRLGNADALLETLGQVANQALAGVLEAATRLGVVARRAPLRFGRRFSAAQ